MGVKCSEEKDVGEIWVSVIKTINSILWASVASNGRPPEWGQGRSQYMARRGPCRTYSPGASRRPKPKYVHFSIPACRLWWDTESCHVCACYDQCHSHVITGVYFRRLKINHESQEFTLDPVNVANNNLCWTRKRKVVQHLSYMYYAFVEDQE